MGGSERLEKAYEWLEEIQNSWSYGEQELRRCEAEIQAAKTEIASTFHNKRNNRNGLRED